MGTRPRTGIAGITISGWRASFASLRYRHIANYRLDGLDPSIWVSGLDVLDLAVTRPARRWVDIKLGIDNLTNKVYNEPQNYFESRVTPRLPLCTAFTARRSTLLTAPWE